SPPPAACPVCATPAVRRAEVVAWRCPNPFCPAGAAGRLRHFAGRDACDITGLGERAIDLLLELGLARGPADLLRLRREQLAGLPGWGGKSAANLVASIARSRERPWAAKIFALGLPGVGTATAATLAARFPTIAALRAATAAELCALPDIGEVVARDIGGFFTSPEGTALVDELAAAGFWKAREDAPPPPAPGASPLAGRTYVLTGTLPGLTRAEVKRALEARGARVTGSVSRRTTAVVAGDEPGGKLDDAVRLGVPVLDEAGLRRLLAGGEGDHAG
ncbi:MAG: helix-hairpin-helix domain-containing protein, partial [Candidatus Krumholzibacteriia bacterium]